MSFCRVSGGPELAKSVASLRPETTVLYASGHTGDLIERYGISGSAHFIEKPFSFDSLARKLKELLELGKLQKSDA
jgi:DNA-binding NtrC family response regulator